MLTDAASPGPWIFSTCMSLIATVTILEPFSVPISATEKKQLLQLAIFWDNPYPNTSPYQAPALKTLNPKHAKFPAFASMFGAIISCQQHKYYTNLNINKCQDLNPRP
jgi:hypothetical protein